MCTAYCGMRTAYRGSLHAIAPYAVAWYTWYYLAAVAASFAAAALVGTLTGLAGDGWQLPTAR